MPAATTEASTAEELGADAIAAALEALSDTDLLRLKALARLRVRGLPGLEGTDLLSEAVAAGPGKTLNDRVTSTPYRPRLPTKNLGRSKPAASRTKSRARQREIWRKNSCPSPRPL